MATGCDGENSKHELWQQTGRFSKADQAAFLSDHRSAPDRAVEDVGAAARLMAWILIISRHTRTLAVDGKIVGRAPACTAAARQWRLPHSVQSSSCSPENCSTNLWPQSPGRDTSTTPSVAVPAQNTGAAGYVEHAGAHSNASEGQDIRRVFHSSVPRWPHSEA